MNKPDSSKMNNTERIDFCKNGLIECKKAQRWTLWLLFSAIFGVWLISQYLINDADWTYLIPGVVCLMNFWYYAKLRRVYSLLKEAYEAELNAVKVSQQ